MTRSELRSWLEGSTPSKQKNFPTGVVLCGRHITARTERGSFAFTQHTDAHFFEALGRRFLPSAPSCLVQDIRYMLK